MTTIDAHEIEALAAAQMTAAQYLLLRLNAGLRDRDLIPGLVAWAAHTRAHARRNNA